MPFAQVRAGKVYYEVHGDKEPLMLIAGLGRDHTQWLDFVDELKKTFQVILIDNPASGQSEWKAKDLSIQDMAEAAIAVLGDLKLERVHVVGHSMGGFIAQAMAAFYPERVGRVIVFSAGALPSRASFLTSEVMADLKMHGVEFPTIAKNLGLIGIGMQALLKEGMIEKFVENIMATPYPMSDSQQLIQMKACMAQDSRSYLNKIRSHVLICTGEEDVFAPPAAMEFLYEEIQHSDMVVLKGVGHMIHLEAKEQVINLIQSIAVKTSSSVVS